MTGSSLSLDSLSSPSPSPSPSPPPLLPGNKSAQSVSKDAATRPSLESDSELSELTDDDQDGATSTDKRDRPAYPKASSSFKAKAKAARASAVVSSVDDDDVGRASSSTATNKNTTTKRATHQRTNSTSCRGGPRKKRSSIVPAPMWGWAETKATTSQAPVEEEEEEAGPPRAMEEEEEEPDEPEDEDDYDVYHQGDDFAGIDEEEEGRFVNRRRLGPYVSQRLPGIGSFYPASSRNRPGRRQAPTSSRKYPEEGQPTTNGDGVDGASASGSEYSSPKKRRNVKFRGHTSTSKRKEIGAHESSESEKPGSASRQNRTAHQKEGDVDDDVASDGSAVQVGDNASGHDDTDDEVNDAPVSPSRITKPLSHIANDNATNSATSALATLAVVADAVDTTRDMASGATAAATSSFTAGPPSTFLLSPTSNKGVNADPSIQWSRTASSDNSDDDRDEEPQAGRQTMYKMRQQSQRVLPRSRRESDDRVRFLRSPNVASLTRKGPVLDLKVNTMLNDTDKPNMEIDNGDGMELDVPLDEVNDIERDVDLEGDEREGEEDEGEEEGEDISQRDEEEPHIPDDEAADGDDEPVDPDAEVDGDEDQDQDPEAAEIEQENENENEEVENDEEPIPDGDLEDQEIELQPAHRAEALDVLACIELKFALLRERVYVEKMEVLAWEEAMIQAAVHPEMQYLQKEMTKRRDKRLELAFRKRSYEVANATKRSRADENGVWSWWKLSVEELQTDMIAETNRKRRKLERERRTTERPQPTRRIPLPQLDIPIYPPPSLRKILKLHPFETRKQAKTRRRHRSYSYQPKNLIYPEISTLSATDIANDLEYLYQNRRAPSYITQFGGTPFWGQNPSFAPRNGLNGMSGFGRHMGMGLSRNGGLPPLPSVQPIGPSPPSSIMHQHSLTYEPFSGDVPPYGAGGPPPPPRVRDPPVGAYMHAPGGLPATGSRDSYPEFSGSAGRSQPSSSHEPPPTSMVTGLGTHGYSVEHEMSVMVPCGSGQQLPHQPYYGQGKISSRMSPLPSSSSTFSGVKGVSLNGRHSLSPPPHVLVNGTPGSKQNGNRMDMGINIGSFQLGNGGNGGGRDVRILHEDEERDRTMKERGDRKRADREKEFDRRDQWDREYSDHLETDHIRDQPHMQHLQQRQSHSSSLQHGHTSSAGPPTQGSGVEPHHLSGHHHRPHHHHHIFHRHGTFHASSSLPSPIQSGPGCAPPIVHSPRSTRDYDPPCPPSATQSGPSQSQPTSEVTMPSSSNNSQQAVRDKDNTRSDSVQHSPPFHDHRDRSDREIRKPYMHRPTSGPPMTSLESNEDRNDRPNSTPFMIGSPRSMPPPLLLGIPPSAHPNGSGVGGFISSPKGQTTWIAPAGEDSYRIPSSGYLGGPSSHDHRSPAQGHRYPPSGLGRGIPSSSSSSSLHHITSPPLSNRARPPQSPSCPPHSSLHRSPQTSPKMRRTVTPTGQRPPSVHPSQIASEPVLKASGMPNYGGIRTESPLMASLHQPPSRSLLNGNANNTSNMADRERHVAAVSPRLAPSLALPSKLNTAPVSDRR